MQSVVDEVMELIERKPMHEDPQVNKQVLRADLKNLLSHEHLTRRCSTCQQREV